MLLMAAFEVGNPVEAFVLMKSDDFAWDAGRFCSHGFHEAILRSLLTSWCDSIGFLVW
jgi:hypothetical protein